MRAKPLIIAHRGFSGAYPENTLLAFSQAKKQEVDGFELDIQLSRDKKVIVFHDERLERTTNGSGPIGARKLAELRKLDAGRGQKIPTLDEVLKTFRRGPQLYIELKYHRDHPYRPLVDAFLKALKRHKLKYMPIICSFNWNALAYLRNRDRTIGIEILHIKKPFRQVLRFAEQVRAAALFTNIKEISGKSITLAHSHDLKVFAWTVNKRQAVHRQVDAIITNYPNLFAKKGKT